MITERVRSSGSEIGQSKNIRPTSREVLRNVVLAGVLEPIPEKPGCTTRSFDLNERAKLEYFLTGAVNIGWDFYDLAERIKENNFNQPAVIFDTALSAQEHSFQNRTGSRINFGIIGPLVPVITSQLVYGEDGLETLKRTSDVLRATSKEDVEWNRQFYELASKFSDSKWHPQTLEVPNVQEYFLQTEKITETQRIVQTEYTQGFPISQKVYQIMKVNLDQGLLKGSILAYQEILDKCGDKPSVAADYIAIAMYLILSDFKEEKLVS